MRLVRSYDRRCERAREWLSLAADGELSRFERALVDRHLAGCPECAAFGAELDGFTSALRAAPLEPLTHPIAIPERRRRVAQSLRPVQAAVAVLAVVAVGVGTLSSSLRAPSQGARGQQAAAASTQREIRNALRFRQLEQGEELVLQRQAQISRPVGEQLT